MASWNSDALSGELGSSGPGTTYTMGARAVGTLPRRLDYNVDMAWQTGHRADDDIKAWAGHYALGWMVGNSASKPRVAIEYNHASGDDDPSDGHTSTFDQLYPTNHFEYGTADLLGWRNMHDVVVGFGMLPASSVRLDVAVHRFILGTVADGLYSAGGGGTIWKPHAMSHGRPGSTLEERHRRRPGWPGLGNLCRQAKMPQDALDDRRVVDEGDKAKAPATPGTRKHIQPERALHRLRPETIRSLRTGLGGIRDAAVGLGGGHPCMPVLDHTRPPGGTGAEDAVVQNQVDAQPRDDRGESLQ